MKTKIFIIGVVAAVLVGGGVWYWSQKGSNVAEKTLPTTATETPAAAEVPETPAVAEVKDGLGAEVFNKTKNPLSNELPETNPFQVNTNPFK